MIFIILVLLILVILFGIIKYVRNARRNDYFMEEEAFTIMFFIFVMLGLCVPMAYNSPIAYTIEHTRIDSKIQLYIEQNSIIDKEIKSVVQSTYKKETSLYKEIGNKTTTELITLFPDIKSVSLVNKQLDIYVRNKNNINKLREDLINLEVTKIYYQLW